LFSVHRGEHSAVCREPCKGDSVSIREAAAPALWGADLTEAAQTHAAPGHGAQCQTTASQRQIPGQHN